MNFKSLFKQLGNIFLLNLIFVVVFIVINMVLPFEGVVPAAPEGTETAAMIGLNLVAIVNVLMILTIVMRSHLHGWRLVTTTVFAMIGVTTVMSQIEVAYLGPAMGIPSSMLPALVIPNVVLYIIFVPVAVLILRRWKAGDSAVDTLAVQMSGREWLAKLAAIAVVYLVLYFGFGYVIAWSNPALREMYGSGANRIVFNPYTFIPLQIVRSALWVMFVLPVMRSARGKAWNVAILIACLVAFPMNIGHAVPNGIMPDPSVRFTHFIETTTSNFLFGLFITWLMVRSHSSVGELFSREQNAEKASLTPVKVAGSDGSA